MKDIIRTCNLTVRFSKFTLNIKIKEKFVGFFSKLVWRETLFILPNTGMPIILLRVYLNCVIFKKKKKKSVGHRYKRN